MDKSLVDLTRSCIQCGFCLESCPTFIETGDEAESPRGRISLVYRCEEGLIDRDAIEPHLDRCLGCRACESACPSGVRYGAILELARAQRPNNFRTLKLTTSPPMMRLASKVGQLGLGRVPAWITGTPEPATLPVAEPLWNWPAMGDIPLVKEQVALLTGCAMRSLFPNVHEATRRTLRRLGIEVVDTDLGCCGALHAHQGWLEDGIRAAERVGKAAGGLRIVVNSAGCGSWLKDQETAGVCDISEIYLEAGLIDLLSQLPGAKATLTYHDACHLSHGQRIRQQPRDLLGAIPGLSLIPLAESELCCGSAGIYSVTQPEMARKLRDRKWENIEATGAQAVVLGNPGCHAWLAQAARERESRVRVRHTAEVLEAVLSGWGPIGPK